MTFKYQKLTDLSQKIVIAIDGTAASGKGTLSKLLSKKFNMVYCQTSLFYRQLAYNALKQNIDVERDTDKVIDLSAVPFTIKQNIELYSPSVTHATSVIAAIPEVRANLKKPQQDFLSNHARIVMEGRDIGAIIAPNADIKLFVTASLDVRAMRRYIQIHEFDSSVDLETIKNDIALRDERDATRATSPLICAEDAIEVDTSSQSPDEIIEHLITIFKNSCQ
jgi:cytidylate kinase